MDEKAAIADQLVVPIGTQVVLRSETVVCEPDQIHVKGQVAEIIQNPLPYLPKLIARKRDGAEQQTLPSAETAFYEKEFAALRERLVTEAATTKLPEANSAAPTLNDMLVRIRLNGLSSR